MSEGVWYLDPEAGAVEAEDEETYDEAFGPHDGHPSAGHDSAEAAAVHERADDELELDDEDDETDETGEGGTDDDTDG